MQIKKNALSLLIFNTFFIFATVFIELNDSDHEKKNSNVITFHSFIKWMCHRTNG
ncbi:MAG: hypothetical protein H6Q13_1253 [Bacteroidetes bacterium]|nr:hypothetical protein [Bacteroidota bacterium]